MNATSLFFHPKRLFRSQSRPNPSSSRARNEDVTIDVSKVKSLVFLFQFFKVRHFSALKIRVYLTLLKISILMNVLIVVVNVEMMMTMMTTIFVRWWIDYRRRLISDVKSTAINDTLVFLNHFSYRKFSFLFIDVVFVNWFLGESNKIDLIATISKLFSLFISQTVLKKFCYDQKKN